MATATAAATPEVRLSRVGKRPVSIPKGVTVNVTDVKLDVQGPKGKMSVPIPGQVPQTSPPAHACAFADRCPDVMPRCRAARPALVAIAPGQEAACFLHHAVAQ